MSTLSKPQLKTCSKCKQAKPIDSFTRSMEYVDGRVSNCKACYAKRESNRRAERKKLQNLYGI